MSSQDTTNNAVLDNDVADPEQSTNLDFSKLDITHDIPDGGYGWVVVFAIFMMNANSWGANAGFAIYLSHYLNHNTFEGGDKFDYALIGGMTFGVGLLFAPVINYIEGIIGTRNIIILGNCFQFTALMMASFAKSLWQLYLTQGLLQSFGIAFIALPAMSILPQWFKAKRTLASAIAAGGAGVGGVLYNLGMQRVLESKSVFWALRVQSILCFGLLWISIALVRTRHKKNVEFRMYDMDCLRSAGFWILVFYLITCMFGYVTVLYDMANVATSMGYSAYQGSIAAALVLVGSFFGRPLVGLISDRVGALTTTAIAYLLSALFVFAMWIPASNFATLVALCVIMGGLMGSVFATMPTVLSKLFGLTKVNIALGMSWIFLGISGITAPVIGLTLKTGNSGYVDRSQYQHCSIFAGCAFFACALSLLLIRGYVISREDLADDVDADVGHLHIRVLFWAPVKNCLRPVGHV